MTDEERCEVAAELRELAQDSARCGDDGVGERACRVLLGPRIDLLDVVDAHFPLARLADLIELEERTCYVEHIDDDSFHLSCGHEAAGHVSPSFCPYCGAKVVEQ